MHTTAINKFKTNINPPLVTKEVKRATITPIEVNEKAKLKPFTTLDIETINHDNKEYPIAISLAAGYQDDPDPETYFLSIDKSRLKYNKGILDTLSLEAEVLKLWRRLYRTLVTLSREVANNIEIDEEGRPKEKPILTIFVHNLGAFDGYFIFKYLTPFYKPKNINTIIDKQNKFIIITFIDEVSGVKINFIDSYRLFPVSLDNLSKVFLVTGKSMKYDKERFHNISLFYDDEVFKMFKNYSIQDSQALWKALERAQRQYWDEYKVDITTVVSASSLAFKIFRTKYLKDNIPIPLPEEDAFNRDSS